MWLYPVCTGTRVRGLIEGLHAGVGNVDWTRSGGPLPELAAGGVGRLWSVVVGSSTRAQPAARPLVDRPVGGSIRAKVALEDPVTRVASPKVVYELPADERRLAGQRDGGTSG